MNVEAYESNNQCCVVRSHNGEVRVLEKNHHLLHFNELLYLENILEDLKNQIEDNQYEIDKLIKKNNSKAYLHLLVLLAILINCFIFHNFSLSRILIFTGFMEMIGFIFDGVIPFNIKKIRSIQKKIRKLKSEEEETNKDLSRIKHDIQLKEEKVVESDVNNDEVNQIYSVAYQNNRVSQLYDMYSLRALCYELMDYAKKNNINFDIDNIQKTEILYPGISKVLKK